MIYGFSNNKYKLNRLTNIQTHIHKPNQSNNKPMGNNITQNKCFQLLTGIAGIYGCYWVAGYLIQKILKQPYQVHNTVQYTQFDSPITLIWAQSFVAWMLGWFVNTFFYKQHTKMPVANIIACAIVVIISTHTYILAIYITSFPIVMMVKSCNIISVVFVGIFCSRVRDKGLQLGVNKIIVAVFITVGILMYNFGGDVKHQQKATDILGVILLVISLVADGFLPDFQAVIKSQYKPRPLQMFQHINKWVVLLCWCYSIATGQMYTSYQFATRYPQFVKDIVMTACLTSIGQVFVYRMIKQFKQHIVPFVITTRKIFTVVISIVFYNHPTTSMQILAIVIVFLSASWEYLSEIYGQKKADPHHNVIQVPDTEDKIELAESDRSVQGLGKMQKI